MTSRPDDQDWRPALADLVPLEVAARRVVRRTWRLLGLGADVSWPESVGVLVLAAWLQDGHAPGPATARRAVSEMADLVVAKAIADDVFASASDDEVRIGHGLGEDLPGLVTSVHLAGVQDAVLEARQIRQFSG